MSAVVININLDAKCAECRKGGATPSRLCLRCVTKAMDPKRAMKSPEGRSMQQKLLRQFAASHSKKEGE